MKRDTPSIRQRLRLLGQSQTLPVILSGILISAGILTGSPIWFVVAAVAGIRHVLPRAWRAGVDLRPDMNLLMIIAIGGALLLGEITEAATVSFLFALSLVVESWSVGRARHAIDVLMELAPVIARVRGEDGVDRDVPAEDVPIGSRVIVRPGDRIPLDGFVTAGTGDVNQASITGESFPVIKRPGDTVFAGSINGSAAFEIETHRVAGDTVLASMIRQVGESRIRKAPIERWVDRFARVYTPVVMALSAIVAVAGPLLTGDAWSEWIYRGLVLLVIACPCALVISIPVCIVAAIASAARHGVLIKGGGYLEIMSRVDTVVFDKTGTLTEGRLQVETVRVVSGRSETDLGLVAGALASHSAHPVSRALAERFRERFPVESFVETAGRGSRGILSGRDVWLGSPAYLEDLGFSRDGSGGAGAVTRNEGRTVVYVGDSDGVLGEIVLSDRMREGARRAVEGLLALGVERIEMLTGDIGAVADGVAGGGGIEDVRSGMMPGEKVVRIEALVEAGRVVAMVGDGVNDAPAMARASVSIAMGALGSDAAIEAADVALMDDDLGRIPWLIGLSRKALRIVHENIGIALGVKGIFVVLAAVGWVSVWGAVVADMGSSFLVIGNALRVMGGWRRRRGREG